MECVPHVTMTYVWDVHFQIPLLFVQNVSQIQIYKVICSVNVTLAIFNQINNAHCVNSLVSHALQLEYVQHVLQMKIQEVVQRQAVNV